MTIFVQRLRLRVNLRAFLDKLKTERIKRFRNAKIAAETAASTTDIRGMTKRMCFARMMSAFRRFAFARIATAAGVLVVRIFHRRSAAEGSQRRTLFWRGGGNQFLEAPATAGKLLLRPGNLGKFTAAGLPVFENAGLSVTAQTLDPAEATQE